MDRRAWQATVHRVAQNWTQLKQFSTHSHTHSYAGDSTRPPFFPGCFGIFGTLVSIVYCLTCHAGSHTLRI